MARRRRRRGISSEARSEMEMGHCLVGEGACGGGNLVGDGSLAGEGAW